MPQVTLDYFQNKYFIMNIKVSIKNKDYQKYMLKLYKCIGILIILEKVNEF